MISELIDNIQLRGWQEQALLIVLTVNIAECRSEVAKSDAVAGRLHKKARDLPLDRISRSIRISSCSVSMPRSCSNATAVRGASKMPKPEPGSRPCAPYRRMSGRQEQS